VRAVDRVALVILSAGFGVVGIWAQFAPQSFYDDFPGGGRHWVTGDGPFNEHLIRDVGGLNLALTVIAVAALNTGSALVTRLAGLVALPFVLPHAVYHSAHLSMFADTVDKMGLAISLWGTVVLAVVLAVGPWSGRVTAGRRAPG
jgi:hypothetical protein